MKMRNAPKAIIIKDGKLLCTKNEDELGLFYMLPGGGQEPFETITEALIRECKEEINAEIEINDIVFVRDYIGRNHDRADWDSDVHQIEYMFECNLVEGTNIRKGIVPDNKQIGIEWLDLKELKDKRIYPKELVNYINEDGIFDRKIYLGDIN